MAPGGAASATASAPFFLFRRDVTFFVISTAGRNFFPSAVAPSNLVQAKRSLFAALIGMTEKNTFWSCAGGTPAVPWLAPCCWFRARHAVPLRFPYPCPFGRGAVPHREMVWTPPFRRQVGEGQKKEPSLFLTASMCQSGNVNQLTNHKR